ncbi:Mad3/BUB1 homology region 1-domain-containing protein [Suillus occidentalis]|nr:Mad3/BUB1 homology region 1-domain-containing protein [Suillus occidentalis]
MENTEADVFKQAPMIVDCDVLEAAKENIQPLASGRRVTTLSAILQTPHAQREAQLLAARKRFRANIQIALEDEDDDPLEAYSRFVQWTLENYPQGQSAESGLLELLEEATRVLKDDREGRWKRTSTYLKLWVLYASYVEKPTIIYKFLLANDIGTDHALLYEEHAAALERAGRRSEADAAYLLGIARQASPLDRLVAKHGEFQKRMMTAATMPPQPATNAPPRRTALGVTSSSSAVVPLFASTFQAPSSSSQVDASEPRRGPRLGTNARLQIFVDPSGADSADATDSVTPYPDIGTRKSRVKENVPEVSKAAGSTLKQAGRTRRIASGPNSGAIVSKIVPFRDSRPDMDAEGKVVIVPPPVPMSRQTDVVPKTPTRTSAIIPLHDVPDVGGIPSTQFTPFRDEPEINTSAATLAPETVMKPKTVGGGPLIGSEAEALRKDPLKNYYTEECPRDD